MNGEFYELIDSIKGPEGIVEVEHRYPRELFRFLRDHESLIDGFLDILRQDPPESYVLHGSFHKKINMYKGIVDDYVDDLNLEDRDKKILRYLFLYYIISKS